MTPPVCPACDSPWITPENNTLRCCDCGAQWHTNPTTGRNNRMNDLDYDNFIARGKQWRELLPEGRYAWPLLDWDSDWCDTGQDMPPLIGYCVYWKRRKGGMTRLLMLAEGIESTRENRERLREAERTDENCDDETRLADIVDNPASYAGTYGMHTGKCGICGRKLTDRESVERGIGPDCARTLAPISAPEGTSR